MKYLHEPIGYLLNIGKCFLKRSSSSLRIRSKWGGERGRDEKRKRGGTQTTLLSV